MKKIYKTPSYEIAQLGQPVLRAKTQDVKNIKDKKIKKLIKELTILVMKVDGVGIAAPQLNQSLKIFILASHPSPRYPHAPNMKPTVIINPKIIKLTGKKTKDWEGCLSIPGIRGLVPRYEKVEVEYQTNKDLSIKTHFSGFLARIFQHEYDHLDGIVFLDRLDSIKDLITEKEFQKLLKTIPSK